MKAYTVYQPYAYATVAGMKQYETRPRQTHIRGRVAVHAGKKRFAADGISEILNREIAYGQILNIEYLRFLKGFGNLKQATELAFGAVVGTVEIVDCVPVEEVADKLTPLERALGDFSPGRFAWVLKNPIMFEKPIPARGKQGWWDWKEPEDPTAEDTVESVFKEIKECVRWFLGGPKSETMVAQLNERIGEIVRGLYIKGEIGVGPMGGYISLGEVPIEFLIFIPYAISEISIFGTYRVLQKGKVIGSVSYGGPQTQDTSGTVYIGARTKFTPAEKMAHISMKLENPSYLGFDEI